mgnify:CR=1 FL=1
MLFRSTYADDLARAIVELTKDNAPAYGVWNAVGGPATTWFGFASAVVAEAHAQELINRQPEMVEITTADYPLPARRPPNSVLEPSKELNVDFDWRTAIRTVIARLKANTA